jgi:hypothetical protein
VRRPRGQADITVALTLSDAAQPPGRDTVIYPQAREGRRDDKGADVFGLRVILRQKTRASKRWIRFTLALTVRALPFGQHLSAVCCANPRMPRPCIGREYADGVFSSGRTASAWHRVSGFHPQGRYRRHGAHDAPAPGCFGPGGPDVSTMRTRVCRHGHAVEPVRRPELRCLEWMFRAPIDLGSGRLRKTSGDVPKRQAPNEPRTTPRTQACFGAGVT